MPDFELDLIDHKAPESGKKCYASYGQLDFQTAMLDIVRRLGPVKILKVRQYITGEHRWDTVWEAEPCPTTK